MTLSKAEQAKRDVRRNATLARQAAAAPVAPVVDTELEPTDAPAIAEAEVETPAVVPEVEAEPIRDETVPTRAEPTEPEVADLDTPSGAPTDPLAEAGEAGAAPAGRDLSEFVTLNGPASYGPVVVSGKRIRFVAGTPLRVTDVAERLALLGLPVFRLATEKDYRPRYSGPINTALIHGDD